jgi:hypothetical protein
MPQMDENTFSKLIAMMEDGCSASSSAKALGMKLNTIRYRMSPQQRQQFDYAKAANMHVYAAATRHKPESVKQMEQ